MLGMPRQDVVGSILADSMLSMPSEPSQPSGHDTADHFTGWSEKGESGKGRVKTKKYRGQDLKYG